MKESVMPSEDDLRKEFHDNEPGPAIDLDAVLRRSRARRRPRVAAAAIVSSLAVWGIVAPVPLTFATPLPSPPARAAGPPPAPPSPAGPVRLGGEPTNGDGASGSEGIKPAPAEKINLCAGTVA